jgi:RimJ/RimL family protein N-acetyltransferase
MDDLDSLYELWTNADVKQFLFDDRQISREEAQSLLEASETNFTHYGYGLWLFFENHTDQLAGFAGLLHSTEALPSLIFATNPPLWKRGYAREAALAVLGYAFEVLQLQGIVADVDEPNVASIRVLEELGLSQYQRAIVNDRPLLFYELQAHNWNARA